MQKEKMVEQMMLSDLDGVSMKMFPAHSPATKARTGDASSKRLPKLSRKMPLFLNLRKADGHTQEASSWSMGLWLGASQTLNTGELHKDGREFAYSLTSTDSLPSRFCLTLNIGEYPRECRPTHLSEILSEADPKYNLSAKACRGILNRAQKRGKELPEILQKALESQANEPDCE